MDKFEQVYNWMELEELFNKYLNGLLEHQHNVGKSSIVNELPKDIKKSLKKIEFSIEPRDKDDVALELINEIYPYRMRTNHPRYFSFIPNCISPYSVFGEFLNSIHNPYGGGFSLSEGVAEIENRVIELFANLAGYNKTTSGGQFVSGGSMANLTASVIARDKHLKEDEFIKGTVYVSDQTHSSVAKAVHIMGIAKDNIRKIKSNNKFQIDILELEKQIELDLKNGYKPFLLVGSAGTTNTGAVDDLEALASIKDKYNMWLHVDGAYGAAILLSSYKSLLKGLELSDSFSLDGHKWLYQTYGCAMIICKDKMDMLKTYSVNPEYLEDVKSTDEDFNFWDMGIEMTKPSRGMKLFFTLQVLGLDMMKKCMDRSFEIADYLEERISEYNHFEIVSNSNLGIVNFRYYDENLSEEKLDEINLNISKKAIEDNYSLFFTTKLNDKIVLRFCCNHPMTKEEEIDKIVENINKYILEL